MSNVYDSRYTAEVANLEKIASKLDTLLKGHKHIIASKGVNMDMAIALEEISPGVVSTRTPVASFTSDISLTNYTVTTEAVSDVIKKVRDALVKAWKAVVQKITDWFNATFRNAKKNAQETKANFASMSQKYAGLKTIEDKLIPLFIEFTAKKSAEANDGKGPATPDDLIKAIHSSAFSILSRSVTKNIIALSRGKQWVGTVTAMGGARDIIADLDAKQKALVTAINKGETIDITQYSVSLTPISKLDTTGNGLALDTGLETVSKLADIISKGSNIYFSSDEKLTLHDPVLAGLFNNTEGTFISVITGIEGILAGDISATLKEVNAGVLKLMSSVGSIDNIANSDALNPILETFRKTLAIVKRIIDTAEMMQRQLSDVSKSTHRALDAWGKQMLEMIANGGFSDDVTKGYKADIMTILKQNASTEDIDNEGPSETTLAIAEAEAVQTEHDRESAEIDTLLKTPATEPLTGLESISDHVKKVIDAIIKAVKSAYERITKWLAGFFKRKPATEKDAEEAAASAKKAADRADTLSPFIKEAAPLLEKYFKMFPDKIPSELAEKGATAKNIIEWRWHHINRKLFTKLSDRVLMMYLSNAYVEAFKSDCDTVNQGFEKLKQLISKNAAEGSEIDVEVPLAFITVCKVTPEPVAKEGLTTLELRAKEWAAALKALRTELVPTDFDVSYELSATNAALNTGRFDFSLPAKLKASTSISVKLLNGMDTMVKASKKAESNKDNVEEAKYSMAVSNLAVPLVSFATNLSSVLNTIIDTISKEYTASEETHIGAFYMLVKAAITKLEIEKKTEDALYKGLVDLKERMDPVYEKISTESVEVMVDEDGESALDDANELAGEEESAGELDKIVGLQATMEELGLGSAGHVASDVALHQLREKAIARSHLKTVSKIDSLLSA